MSPNTLGNLYARKLSSVVLSVDLFGDFDNILILLCCRIRPLNTTEEKTGSKVIVKFPAGSSDDQCISVGVSSHKQFSWHMLRAGVKLT